MAMKPGLRVRLTPEGADRNPELARDHPMGTVECDFGDAVTVDWGRGLVSTMKATELEVVK